MDTQGRPLAERVDLNLLELFDMVYATRNLTQSGELLGLSQPAVSYGLARLREAYGDALFLRRPRGVEPTPFADLLAVQVAVALRIVRGTIEKERFVPARSRRHFRIATTDIGERFFMPRLSARLLADAPDVTVETLAPGLLELSDGLASGQIDLAVGFIPGLGKQVHQQLLFRNHFVYLMRSGHPALGSKITISQMRRLQHIVPDPLGTQHFTAVEKVLTQPRIRAQIALRVRSFLSVGPIVAQTDLVSVVPNLLASLVEGNLDLRQCRPPVHFPEFEISMYWHRRYHQEPSIQWLRSLFVELFGSGLPGPGA